MVLHPGGMYILDLRRPGNPLWPAPLANASPDEYRAHLRVIYRDGTLQEGLRGITSIYFLVQRQEMAAVLFEALKALGAQQG